MNLLRFLFFKSPSVKATIARKGAQKALGMFERARNSLVLANERLSAANTQHLSKVAELKDKIAAEQDAVYQNTLAYRENEVLAQKLSEFVLQK